ncbi:MAG: hypothetical protein N2544_02975 [Burkholderiales bacterium]|nr:hypothetical protein [Burkholderiales bacterium]
MRNLVGAMFVLVGAALAWAAVTLRARRIAARRAAGIPDGAEPQSRLFVFGEIVRPILLFFLAWVGVKTVLAYHWLDGGRYLSLFDLGGFLAALAAYGYWLHVKTKHPPVDFYAPVQPEAAGPAAEAPVAALPARGAPERERAAA